MPADEELRALLPVVQERLPTLGAIGDLVGFLWVDEIDVDRGHARPETLGRRRRPARGWPPRASDRPAGEVAFEADELEPPLRALAEARGWKAGDLFMAIRVAVTGRAATPPCSTRSWRSVGSASWPSGPRARGARRGRMIRTPLTGPNEALTRRAILSRGWHERSSSSKTSRPCARRWSTRSRRTDSGSSPRPTVARP